MTKSTAGADNSASALIDFIRDVLASTNFGSLADATKAFNTLAKTQDRELHRSFVRCASELAGLEQSLDAQRAEYVKRIKELTAQKKKCDEHCEFLAKKAADLQDKIDGLTDAINDLHRKCTPGATWRTTEEWLRLQSLKLSSRADVESDLELRARVLAELGVEYDELGDFL